MSTAWKTYYCLDHSPQCCRNIYIRTKAAWYILGKPSASYQEYFAPFWGQVYILHLVIAEAMREPRITYDLFLQRFHKLSSHRNPVASTTSILGHKIDQDDVEQDDVVCLVTYSTLFSPYSLDVI